MFISKMASLIHSLMIFNNVYWILFNARYRLSNNKHAIILSLCLSFEFAFYSIDFPLAHLDGLGGAIGFVYIPWGPSIFNRSPKLHDLHDGAERRAIVYPSPTG